ncbi:hypothetical protein OG978_12595 [Streptomyces sp. NBC_01591]|uniref:hypothetical protein n=1 Tax=Streptomyces sp. NBC_01591 TaxID=2975888 RepID=UPI002DDC501B|nr:hypothetical protein [Streptomyces sp. NBC_01591]WSD68169.1 hypothetical protein OG978_12595 [Streptomyces sp. NBC_01591]
MIACLAEDASPAEVAEILEGVNGALVGALPQLTELVAAAADWTRVRLSFDDPHHNPAFETWTRLAAALGMLQDVREQLEVAEDGFAACPAERTDPRLHEMVNVLRTRELLDDVLGAGPVAAAPSAPDPGFVGEVVDPESRRLAAARQVSPVTTTAGIATSTASPAAPSPPAARPVTRLR